MGFLGRLIQKGENYMIEQGDSSLLSVARAELVSNRLLIVENHKGIAELTGMLVSVRVKGGIMRVSGQGLYIRQLNRREVRVAGHILSLDFEGIRVKEGWGQEDV
jgi:sporulation protein YqfC